mmetsp:Transcript_28111/g.45062  ORF Transcript_28111/g.45062 Transcript_28111/m.45062 type:complete len:203 (-) Transcript_28111:7-615(-)
MGHRQSHGPPRRHHLAHLHLFLHVHPQGHDLRDPPAHRSPRRGFRPVCPLRRGSVDGSRVWIHRHPRRPQDLGPCRPRLRHSSQRCRQVDLRDQYQCRSWYERYDVQRQALIVRRRRTQRYLRQCRHHEGPGRRSHEERGRAAPRLRHHQPEEILLENDGHLRGARHGAHDDDVPRGGLEHGPARIQGRRPRSRSVQPLWLG